MTDESGNVMHRVEHDSSPDSYWDRRFIKYTILSNYQTMKKLLILLSLSIIFQNCGVNVATEKSNKSVTIEAAKTLDQWHLAASNAQFEKYFSLMDKDAVFVGTAKEEVWSKKAFMDFAKPFFDKGKAWSFTKISRNIYITNHNDIVYFDELLNTWMGVCRGSGVLVKKNNKWLIKHYVLSLTVPNDKIKSVMDVIKK